MGGPVHVSWDESPGISTQGMLTYFIQFLQQSGLWQSFVEECPLRPTSPNAPPNQEILGTTLLTILRGHWRYAHIAGIRGDDVLSQLLGLAQLRSVDHWCPNYPETGVSVVESKAFASVPFSVCS